MAFLMTFLQGIMAFFSFLTFLRFKGGLDITERRFCLKQNCPKPQRRQVIKKYLEATIVVEVKILFFFW